MLLPYGLVVSNDPSSPPKASYFFGGSAVGFASVSASSGASVFSTRIGIFVYQSTIVQFLYDVSAVKLRAYTSTDGGVTWAEADAAHAPVYDQVNISFNADPTYGVCQSSINPAICYMCYFSTGGAVATLIPFNIQTGLWGTAKVSTLNLLGAGGANTCSSNMGAVVYRPVDDSVFFITTVCVGNSRGSVKYAQCFPNGAGWINTWNLLSADISGSFASNPEGSSFQFACLDNSGNVDVWFAAGDGTAPSSVVFLWFRRIHADNSLSAAQKITTIGSGVPGFYLTACYCDSSNNLYVVSRNNAVGATMYFAPASDAPAWSSIGLFTATQAAWVDLVQVSGAVNAFGLAADSQTVQQSISPFSAVSTLGVTANPVVAVFAGLLAGGSPLKVTLTFKGVRRIPC